MTIQTQEILEQHGISAELTQHILDITENGRKNPLPIQVAAIPDFSDPRIMDLSTEHFCLDLPCADVATRLGELGLAADQLSPLLNACGLTKISDNPAGLLQFKPHNLEILGTLLCPLVSFGVLNGGSASSYFDAKKNRALSPALFEYFSALISHHAAIWSKFPKALSPAFITSEPTPDGEWSFLALKVRAWLLQIEKYQKLARQLDFQLPWDGLERIMPMFQMVSSATSDDISKAFLDCAQLPAIRELSRRTGVDVSLPLTGCQDLIAAFTIPDADSARQVFLAANGQANHPLGLPGGHGQNFHVLADIYRTMQASGKRLAYLGNIDNLGFLPDNLATAVTVLQPCEASFEFAFKTPLDRKGGVLVASPDGHLTCGDIGQAVNPDLISEAEKQSKPILFNCATGLFKLDALCPSLDKITRNLPVRFSNQDKDAGKYSQAEQTTWEVIGLLDRPLILGVSKQKRFLASKLFMDCILTSGLGHHLTAETESDQELLELGDFMHLGLKDLLRDRYGLAEVDGTWMPRD